MKLRILAIAALLASLGLGLSLPMAPSQAVSKDTNSSFIQLSESNWQGYTSSKGQYQVQIPGQPEQERNSQNVGEETLSVEEIKFEDEDGAYGVVYMELPTAYIRDSNSTDILDEMSDMFLAGMQLQQLKDIEETINLDGYPGREYRLSEEEGSLVLRLYLVEKKMYFLFAASPTAASVNKFIDSFELL
ncbi:MAG: hypothetical protein F6J93_31550 [Oscillatoria sp. SIO1A7]|nr:hypothetical protein [Oscillatoria sp. SIO1A7]